MAAVERDLAKVRALDFGVDLTLSLTATNDMVDSVKAFTRFFFFFFYSRESDVRSLSPIKSENIPTTVFSKRPCGRALSEQSRCVRQTSPQMVPKVLQNSFAVVDSYSLSAQLLLPCLVVLTRP